jgi:hypothetical protein
MESDDICTYFLARMGEKRKTYKLLVGKPEEKRPLGRPRHRRVNNIKMELRDWIDLAEVTNQWRVLVNTVMNLRVP